MRRQSSIKYAEVFKSTDILTLTDVIIGLHRFNLIRNFHVSFDVEQIELFLKNFLKAEVLNRFGEIRRVAG